MLCAKNLLPNPMKKVILSITSLLLFSMGYCQKINYLPTFNDALAKAKAQHKLLFIAINAPRPDTTKYPKLAHAFISGIDSPRVAELFNKNFVSYTVDYTDSASAPLKKQYKTNSYPAYLFIDGRGNLVYQETGNSKYTAKFISMSKKAQDAQASGKTLSNYEDKYHQGNLTPAFIKEYILLKEQLGLYDNAKLADAYVALLGPDVLPTYKEVLFVLLAGPYAYGKAYNFCYAKYAIVDSIYKKEPAIVRSDINQRIIGNTIDEAISRKDADMAQQAANYVEGTWRRTDIRKGAINSRAKMLYYYSMVKDTASYYPQAAYFYDYYYMNISTDSAKNLNRTAQASIKKYFADRHPSDTTPRLVKVRDTLKKIYVKSYIDVSGINVTASALNNAAWKFYDLGTHNQTYLTKAMLWTKRAIALDARYNYYDTLAHLLYRLGFYDEAISTQNKAISLAEATHLDKIALERLKTELDKIKTHKLS